jgi:hypothetical protein
MYRLQGKGIQPASVRCMGQTRKGGTPDADGALGAPYRPGYPALSRSPDLES